MKKTYIATARDGMGRWSQIEIEAENGHQAFWALKAKYPHHTFGQPKLKEEASK